MELRNLRRQEFPRHVRQERVAPRVRERCGRLAAERLEDRRLFAIAALDAASVLLSNLDLSPGVIRNAVDLGVQAFVPPDAPVSPAATAPAGVGGQASAGVASASGATIEVIAPNLPPAAQAALRHAADIWQGLLSSPVPIVIHAKFEAMEREQLGGARPSQFDANFPNRGFASTIYPCALANALAGQDRFPNDPDILATFNSNQDWYFGTDGNAPPDRVSFAYVALHEIAHGLGFFGSMTIGQDGRGFWGSGTNMPFIFDRFTENGVGQRLTNSSLFPNPSQKLAEQLTSQDLYFDGANAKAANGGRRVPLYAPRPWQPGSSYSHLDADVYGTTQHALMTPDTGRGAKILSPGSITLGIMKDLGWRLAIVPPPTLAVSPVSADQPEGNSASTAYTFIVTRSGNTAEPSSVRWAVTGSGSNPATGGDFRGQRLPSGSVTFAIGETSKSVAVAVSGDTRFEADEGFTVTLSAPTNATISTPSATGVIRNDDDEVVRPTVGIAATSADKLEGDAGGTAYTFTVTRSGNTAGTSSVRWALAGSGQNPVDAADFVGGKLSNGTVAFAAGETSKSVTVTVSGDTRQESDEGFVVVLSTPTNATIAVASAQGVVRNDDRDVLVASRMVMVGDTPHGMRGKTAQFKVRLLDAYGKPLAGQRVTFTASCEFFGTKQVRTAFTNSSGIVTLAYVIPMNPLADNITLKANYAGAGLIQGSFLAVRLEIGRP